jgi:hypothetical protein
MTMPRKHALEGDVEDEIFDQDSELALLMGQDSSRSTGWRRRRRKKLALWRKHRRQRPQKAPKREWRRLDWNWWVNNFLTPKEFKRLYKLDKWNFPRQLKRLVPHMEKARPANDKEAAVPYELELACTMRWLSGGNYLDIMYHHGISESAFWRGIHACVYALLLEHGQSELGDDKFFDEEKLAKIEQTFADVNNKTIRGCVGDIDGCAIRINRPTEKECANPSSYWNRKGFYAVVLQAICDGNCKFLWGSIVCAGGTHDATCWVITNLYR